MHDIKELARLLKELDKDLSSCTRCGMCQAVCPLYLETGRESDVARGKLVLVENLGREMLNSPEAVKERLDRCLLCGSCSAACPRGIDILNVFLKARAIITGYLGLTPLKKAVFRGFLSDPERFERLVKGMALFQGPLSKTANETLGYSCSRLVSPFLGDRHYPRISKTPWHRKAVRRTRQAGSAGIRIAFYPGCIIDKALPRVADACLEVLEFHGMEVFVPDRVPCCGIPALAAGDMKTFESLVRQNISILGDPGFDFIVTPCATCTSTIKKIWPSMSWKMPAALRKKILEISAKTRDISEFLTAEAGIHKAEGLRERVKTVTYHDPCHLKKSLGVDSQPRAILNSLKGWRFAEMKEADRCCGMGGSFNLEHYELSMRIGQKKLERIIESGADAVATGCPACMLQIADLLSHAGCRIEVKHTVELYAEELGCLKDCLSGTARLRYSPSSSNKSLLSYIMPRNERILSAENSGKH